MPAAALVEAGSLFGLQSGSIRVALARLLADGRIAREGRARYRLGSASEPVHALVRSWRHLDERTRSWCGAWILAQLPGRTPRAQRARSRRALHLLGFAELRSGLFLRPSNLRQTSAATRTTLLALGLEAGALCGELDALDADSEAAARNLWDHYLLVQTYREMRDALETSGPRLQALAPGIAMAESYLVGGQAIQQLVRDPLLPNEILPTRERDALVAALRNYDALGRACWAPFLQRFDVTHRSTPQDTQVAANLERLRA